MSIRGWIRSQDFFGHQVSLNFDKKGDKHNTTIGGFFSIFIRGFITWYVVIKFMKLLTYGDDTMQYTESLVELNSTGPLRFHDTGFFMFGVLKNLDYHKSLSNHTGTEHSNPIFLEENVERFI